MKPVNPSYTFFFLLFFISKVSLAQYGLDFHLSFGGQYIIPQKTLKDISRRGIGFEYILAYQFPLIKFGVIHLASINDYTSHETISWGWPGTNDPRPKKFQSLQTLGGFTYKLNPVFFGGGIGYTALIGGYNEDFTSGMSQFLLVGVNPVNRFRAIGKYVFNRRKEYFSLYKRSFDNFSLSFYYDIWKIE